MKPDRRGSWYLLTGVILGVALGLLYAWLISPVKYVDAPPYALRADYKDEYRALIASAYLYNLDMLRAQERLAQLKDENPVHVLALQAQQALAEGRPAEEAQALNALSRALGGAVTPGITDQPPLQGSTAMPPAGVLSPTPLINQPTDGLDVGLQTTPIPTPGGPYTLQETRMLCDVSQTLPLIQVDIRDDTGQPIPGVEVLVDWESGNDHFFTGLQPELGLGYGDFIMTPDTVYSIRLSDGEQVANNLTAAECTASDGSNYWGTWQLLIVQE